LRTDSSERLHMHHKFAIIDQRLLLNGSFNWTSGAVKGNRENLVVSSNRSLTLRFGAEFERLWEAFGHGQPGKAASGRYEGDVAPLFFPEQGSANVALILAELSAAAQSIDVAMFTLTHDALVNAVLEAHQRGCIVRVITDNRQAHCKGADAQRLAAAGVAVRTDSSFYAMHHKFAIVDGRVVINGSFNWTVQATNGNQEDVIIYRRASGLAGEFTAEFERMWRAFRPLSTP